MSLGSNELTPACSQSLLINWEKEKECAKLYIPVITRFFILHCLLVDPEGASGINGVHWALDWETIFVNVWQMLFARRYRCGYRCRWSAKHYIWLRKYQNRILVICLCLNLWHLIPNMSRVLTLKGPIPHIYGTQVWLSLCLQMS